MNNVTGSIQQFDECARKGDVDGVIRLSYLIVAEWLKDLQITLKEDIEDIQQDVAMEIWELILRQGAEQPFFSLNLTTIFDSKTKKYLITEELCN